jgi:hypothetical protein
MLDQWFQQTPVEPHHFAGLGLFVKREDLATVPPMPPLSKARGIGAHLLRLRDTQGVRRVGVLDTKVSKSGLAVAILAETLGLACDYFFPAPKGEDWKLPHRLEAQRHGAQLCPLPGGRIVIAYARAKAAEPGHMLPLGFPLYETVMETAKQVSPWPGTVVLACGTGTISAGLLLGFASLPDSERPAAIYSITASMAPAKVSRTAACHLARALSECLLKADDLQTITDRWQIIKEGND